MFLFYKNHQPFVVTVSAIASLFCFTVCTSMAALDLQPANKHSSLVTGDGGSIRDDTFATMIANKLKTGATSNVKDAKFIFEQCFGGGMLDDLATQLGNTVKWVGGAAARWDEPSWGPGNPTTKGDFWVESLLPELAPPKDNNQSVLNGLDNATANDPARPGGGLKDSNNNPVSEHGQSTSANGGDTITLKDPAAASHHAILWGGNADGQRHVNDLNKMKAALEASWGTGPSTSITVLTGATATKAQLQAALDALPLNSNEEFVFFASDHGDLETVPAPAAPRIVPPANTDVETFSLLATELLAMELGGPGGGNASPFLTVDYSGVTGSTNAVLLNGNFLGFLNPFASETIFNVPFGYLSASDTIDIQNAQGSSFTILDKIFSTGSIDTLVAVPVPEPATYAVGLLCLGVGIAARRRRRKV